MSVRIFSDRKYSFGDASGLAALAADGIPADATVIYRGRNTVALAADGLSCIKSYKVPGLVKGLIYGLFRKPKAERAYANACRLLAMGISTPEPLGAVVCRSGPLLRHSYYVCRYMRGWSDLRRVEESPDFFEIARALAAFIFRLHAKGVYMKDFSMGNVLYRQRKGKYEFCLIDINRMEFDVADRSLLIRNFGAALDTPAGITVLARRYAELADPSNVDGLVADIRAYFAAHQRRLLRRRRLKRWWR